MIQVTRIFVLLTTLFLVTLFSTVPCQAQRPGPFQQGMAELKLGRYNMALPHFEEAVKAAPQYAQAHYCLAVCYHQAGRFADAQREYAWVYKNCPDEALKQRAKRGYDGAGGSLISSRHAQVTAPSTMSSGGQTSSPFDAIAGEKPAPLAVHTPAQRVAASRPDLAQPSVMPSSGSLRIVDIYTDWCGWCKKFEPLFEQAQAKYGGRITFERMNAETPENKPLVQQWGVTGYPTILFFDESGNIVERISGCPKTFQSFETRLLRAFPSVR